jgi:biopolymer transport protein ExbD
MPLKTHYDDLPQLNMTPMIDCVFLLLIFFLLGTKFTEIERKIPLKIPEVREAQTLSPAPSKKIINVYRDGNVTLDNKNVTVDELTQRLKTARNQYNELAVLVRGDAQGQFQRIAEVLNACKQAGIQELNIGVRPLPTTK